MDYYSLLVLWYLHKNRKEKWVTCTKVGLSLTGVHVDIDPYILHLFSSGQKAVVLLVLHSTADHCISLNSKAHQGIARHSKAQQHSKTHQGTVRQ